MEEGFPVPVLDDAPEVPVHLAWVMSMFRDLRSCRPLGMSGAGQIPVTAMLEYFDAMGLSRLIWPETKLYWMSLDSIELSHYYEKQAAKMPKLPDGGR